LYKDTRDYFNEISSEIPCIKTYDKGHNRIEKREYRLLTENHEFIRYFITSLNDVNEFADSARKHWAIENQLYWGLLQFMQ